MGIIGNILGPNLHTFLFKISHKSKIGCVYMIMGVKTRLSKTSSRIQISWNTKGRNDLSLLHSHI